MEESAMRLTICAFAVCVFTSPIAAFASPVLATNAGWTLEGRTCSASGTALASCTQAITYAYQGLPRTGQILAESAASFGQLSLRFSTTELLAPTTGSVLTGFSSFTDELTISGGTGT